MIVGMTNHEFKLPNNQVRDDLLINLVVMLFVERYGLKLLKMKIEESGGEFVDDNLTK